MSKITRVFRIDIIPPLRDRSAANLLPVTILKFWSPNFRIVTGLDCFLQRVPALQISRILWKLLPVTIVKIVSSEIDPPVTNEGGIHYKYPGTGNHMQILLYTKWDGRTCQSSVHFTEWWKDNAKARVEKLTFFIRPTLGPKYLFRDWRYNMRFCPYVLLLVSQTLVRFGFWRMRIGTVAYLGYAIYHHIQNNHPIICIPRWFSATLRRRGKTIVVRTREPNDTE